MHNLQIDTIKRTFKLATEQEQEV